MEHIGGKGKRRQRERKEGKRGRGERGTQIEKWKWMFAMQPDAVPAKIAPPEAKTTPKFPSSKIKLLV